MHKMSNFLWGLLFIGVGLFICLDVLNIVHINIFFDGWWSLFIIIPCFIGLLDGDGFMGNFIGLLIGVFLLLGAQGIIDFELVFKLIFPVILIIIGFSIMFKDQLNNKVHKEIKNLKKSGDDYLSLFGSQNYDFSNQDFDGCNLTSIFGGIECNLVDSKIKHNSIINANAIFGSITIYVPDNVNVKVTSTPIFAGVSNRRKVKNNSSNVTLYISVTSIFGGVEIR